MTRKALALLVVGIVLIVAGGGLIIKILFFSESSGPAALQVNAFPKADVFINNERVGQTPYSTDKLSSGDYTLRLSAVLADKTLSWSGKILLTPDTLSYINRELGADNDSSAGEILFLEKLSGPDRAEIAVVVDPIGAVVRIDNQDRGQAPLTVKDIAVGDHEVILTSPGFRDRIIHPKVLAGFRVNIVAQLAKDGQALTSVVSPTPTPVATKSGGVDKPYVIVKQTPTGWLRVRVAPSTTATESGRINPMEKYSWIAEQTGWVKIKIGESEGWVSDDYVQVVK